MIRKMEPPERPLLFVLGVVGVGATGVGALVGAPTGVPHAAVKYKLMV